MALLTTVLAFVVALGCLIVVHEFGHYLAARAAGVKVLRFSVGFGRALWTRRLGRDGTEWAIAAFPLGGYVKMLDEREGAVAPEERERAFNRQPVARRIAVVCAGPAANFVLAIALYWYLFVTGVPGLKALLGAPLPGTPAHAAGLAAGDTVIAVDGRAVPSWQDLRWIVLQRALERRAVRIEVRGADGELRRHTLDLARLTAADLDGDFLRTLGLVRQAPRLKPVIGEVIAGGAAERAGLRPGDVIAAVDGRPIERWDELVRAVHASPGRPLVLEVRRAGAGRRAVTIVPEPVLEGGARIGRIGAAARLERAELEAMTVEVRYGPLESLGRALAKTWETSLFSLKMLGKMVVGEVSLRNLSGPITIADYAGQSAQSGLAAYLLFLALISISLGVLNLMPIPVLDGGHLMYYIVEVVKGSPVSDRAIEIGQHVGIAVLFALMAFALYNDIFRLIGG